MAMRIGQRPLEPRDMLKEAASVRMYIVNTKQASTRLNDGRPGRILKNQIVQARKKGDLLHDPNTHSHFVLLSSLQNSNREMFIQTFRQVEGCYSISSHSRAL